MKKNFENLEDLVQVLNAYNSLNKSDSLYMQLNFNNAFIKSNKFLDLTLSLPYSGKNDTVLAVIGSTEDEFFAKQNGVSITGITELQDALNNKTKIDHLICNSTHLNTLNPILLSLGYANLLPSKAKGTLTTDVKKSINFFKETSIFIKQKTPKMLYLKVGELSYSLDMIKSNIDYTLNKIYTDVASTKSSSKTPNILGITAHNSPMLYVSL